MNREWERKREREEDNYEGENYRVTYTSRSLQIANEPALGGFRISKTTVNHRHWSVVMKSKKETKEEAEKRRVTRRKREKKKGGKRRRRKSEKEDRIPE